MKKLLYLLGILLLSQYGYSQKEAYNWYFGKKAGIRFHSGAPVGFNGNAMTTSQSSVSMSDKFGNPLFYSNGKNVWHMGNVPMPNGMGLYASGGNSQPCIAFEKPGSPGCYYLVTTGDDDHPGCWYSIINMNKNGGLGEVEEKNVFITGTERTKGIISAVKHANNHAFWVIVRSLEYPNTILSYLVDERGFHMPAKKTVQALRSHGTDKTNSVAKISPDGRFYVYVTDNWDPESQRIFELYFFDPASGQMTPKFTFLAIEDKEMRCNGLEFSADGNKLYLCLLGGQPGPPQVVKQVIRQFFMNQTTSFTMFENNSYNIYGEDVTSAVYGDMQLGPDGKIYIAQSVDKRRQFLSRLGFPHLSGTLAGFEKDTVKLLTPGESTHGLPLITASYLTKFDWTGNCFGDTTYFKSKILPAASSIKWDFGDPDSGPNNEAYGISQKHLFTKTGTFTVTITIEYPREDIEVYTRKVTITNYPVVNLPNDFSGCAGTTTSISPGLVIGEKLWSTGETGNFIMADVPGEYWIRVENNYGCVSSDTVKITAFDPPVIDNSGVKIVPAICDLAVGSINGVNAIGTGPFNFFWKDNDENIICTTAGLNNYASGTYNLWVTDGNGCTNFLSQFEIPNDGNNFIDDVDPSPEYCGMNNGRITIYPVTSYDPTIEYSINNGATWSDNNVFNGLTGGIPYYVKARLKSSIDCNWTSPDNPYILPKYDGPLVDSVVPQPSYDLNNNGSIHVYAQGAGILTYTLEGSAPQTSPIFSPLAPGSYSGTIVDENGCTSTFTCIVPQITTVAVNTSTGTSQVCKGVNATIPISITNFNGIKGFKLVLNYDNTLVQALNYQNLNSAFTGSLTFTDNTILGEVVIEWNSATPLNLGNINLLELVFQTLAPGISPVIWDETPTGTVFIGGTNIVINPAYSAGQITIYEQPEVTFSSATNNICEGNSITLTSTVTPAGSYTYSWSLPDGGTWNQSSYTISNTTPLNSGQYMLTVTNVTGCNDYTTTSVTVNPLPIPGFNGDTIYFVNDTVLNANAGYATYLWNNGVTTPSLPVSEEGLYTITVTTGMGCSATGSVTMLPKEKQPPPPPPPPFIIEIPTAFTPNNDGKNDIFRLVTDYEQISSFSMTIYNRWGQMIFETNNAETGWNGDINGEPALRGYYSWKIIYSVNNDPPVEKNGSVMLLR